jgi:hypothetical protein
MRKIEQDIINAIKCKHDVHLSKRDRVICGATIVAYYLWETPIAIVYPDKVIIQSGGFKTRTTKSRLNAILYEFCNMGIRTVKGEWIVSACYSGGETGIAVFREGMTIPRGIGR